jgi:hypothetical protein
MADEETRRRDDEEAEQTMREAEEAREAEGAEEEAAEAAEPGDPHELPVEESGGMSEHSRAEAGREEPTLAGGRGEGPPRIEPLNPTPSSDDLARRYLEGATTEPAQTKKEPKEVGPEEGEVSTVADRMTED